MGIVSIIDCTLRDGGYLNNWNFDDKFQRDVLTALINANIDIIECGFISENSGSDEFGTNYKSIEKINAVLSAFDENNINSKFAVMMRLKDFNTDSIPMCNNKKNSLSIIRVMVYKNEVKQSINTIKKIIDKGYEVHIQPTIISHYADDEIIEMIKMFNEIDYHSIAIVDTFGALNPEAVKNLTAIFDTYANSGKALTLHCHNNLSLAYENMVSFIKFVGKNRSIYIDSSMYGLGRGCGNLPTEKIAEYLNVHKGKTYRVDGIHNFNNNCLKNFKRNISEKDFYAYAITAQKNIHPDYATELILAGYEKTFICKILENLSPENQQTFVKEELKKNCKQL